MPTVQIIRISTNDTFNEDPSLFDRFPGAVQSAGITAQSYGREVEDPNQFYWIIHFDQGFEPEEYGDFTRGLSRISTRVVSTFLQIDDFAAEITDAPVTEIGIMTAKDDADLEAFEGVIGRLRSTFSRKVSTVQGNAWSFNSHNELQLFWFVGWDSMDARNEFEETPDFVKYKGACAPYLDYSMPPKVVHVEFEDHQ